MGDPKSPPKPGRVGILQRNQELIDPLTEPIEPKDMWRQAVQSQRGFSSSPSGSADAYRRQPATIPQSAAAGGKGTRVGKGYETFAAIQVLDKDGRRAAFAADYFDGGGLDNHAEARGVRGLDKNGPAAVPEGRIIVVVDQDCCPSCEARLVNYARKLGVSEIEIHVPERESLRQAGKVVSPKTAAATSFMDSSRPTSVEKLRTISVPRAPVPGPLPAPRARTATIGTMAAFGAGVALGILQAKMKEEMLKDLANMPKPQVDREAAATYFSNPATARAIRLIDLMNKNLEPFGRELADHHAKIVTGTNAELALLALSNKLSVEERREFLTGLEAQLDTYERELNIVFDNLAAAKGLSGKALDAAQAAEDLAKLLDRALVADWLLKQGFSIEEIFDAWDSLKSFSSRVRKVFKNIDRLHDTTAKLLREGAELHSQVNKIYWTISLGQIAEETRKKGIK